MKRVFFLAFLTFSVTNVWAQFYVDSLGYASIGRGTSSSYPFLVKDSNGKGMMLLNYQLQGSGTSYSMYSNSHHKSGRSCYNIYANTSGEQFTNTDRCYGVFSSMTAQTSGRSYAILGYTNRNGAAVYGSTLSSYGATLTQPYAGFFEGATHVKGDLSVTGNISGILLSTPLQPTSSSYSCLQNRNIEDICIRLQGLGTTGFYYDVPQKKRTLLGTNSDEPSIEDLEIEKDCGIEYTEDEVPSSFMEKQIYSKQHYSLSADELEQVFPDLVYDNEDGTKSINYVEMVPILVQAINELQSQVRELKGDNDVMSAKKVATGVDETAESVQTLSLGQNQPNPFSTTTSLEVSVPEDVQSAFIYVYDLTGKKVQQVDITARGKQTVQLNAASLEEGMYLYSLIADGKMVQTRRMIIEK